MPRQGCPWATACASSPTTLPPLTRGCATRAGCWSASTGTRWRGRRATGRGASLSRTLVGGVGGGREGVRLLCPRQAVWDCSRQAAAADGRPRNGQRGRFLWGPNPRWCKARRTAGQGAQETRLFSVGCSSQVVHPATPACGAPAQLIQPGGSAPALQAWDAAGGPATLTGHPAGVHRQTHSSTTPMPQASSGASAPSWTTSGGLGTTAATWRPRPTTRPRSRPWTTPSPSQT